MGDLEAGCPPDQTSDPALRRRVGGAPGAVTNLGEDLAALLQDLTLIPALSGHEERMSRRLRDLLAPGADEVRVDRAGNVIATIGGTQPDAPRVMVFAHLDQLGFVVRRIEPDGFLRLERLGGIPERALPGTRVLVETEAGELLPGVIGLKSHHATPVEERRVVVPYDQLYVDLGAATAEEVHAVGIEPGCPVVYEPRFETLQGGRLSATSLDDRAGCAALVALARLASGSRFTLYDQPEPTGATGATAATTSTTVTAVTAATAAATTNATAAHPSPVAARPAATLYLVGSVQEEFNLRGAMLAAAALQPDIALALDVMVAGDTPDLKDRSDLRLGGGPALGTYSFHGRGTLNGTIPHPALARLARETAAREGILLQRSAALGCLTDSAYVQLVGTGVPSLDLGFAARYTHSPVETCQLSDLEQLVRLAWGMIQGIGSGFSLDRV